MPTLREAGSELAVKGRAMRSVQSPQSAAGTTLLLQTSATRAGRGVLRQSPRLGTGLTPPLPTWDLPVYGCVPLTRQICQALCSHPWSASEAFTRDWSTAEEAAPVQEKKTKPTWLKPWGREPCPPAPAITPGCSAPLCRSISVPQSEEPHTRLVCSLALPQATWAVSNGAPKLSQVTGPGEWSSHQVGD